MDIFSTRSRCILSDFWALGSRSKIAKLKEDIATLQAELAEIAAAQKKADEMRAEEGAAWKEAKADFEAGVEGVGMALQVLRDYYAEKEEAFVQTTHDKATGAASGIIGMLEVVESRGACASAGHGKAHRGSSAIVRDSIPRVG